MSGVHCRRPALVFHAITIYISHVEFNFATIRDNSLREGELTNNTNPGTYKENLNIRFLEIILKAYYNSSCIIFNISNLGMYQKLNVEWIALDQIENTVPPLYTNAFLQNIGKGNGF